MLTLSQGKEAINKNAMEKDKARRADKGVDVWGVEERVMHISNMQLIFFHMEILFIP